MCVDQVVEYGCNLTNHAFEVIWTNPPASKVQKSWNICFWYWRQNQIHVGIISDKVSLIQKYIFSLSKSNHVKWFQREERWTLSTAYWTPSSTTCQVQTLQTPVLAALRLAIVVDSHHFDLFVGTNRLGKPRCGSGIVNLGVIWEHKS